MAQNSCRQEIDASKYRAMSDEELEEILRLDFYKEECDENLQETLLAMKILAERKKARGEIYKSPEEAFESFKKYYVPELDDAVLPDLNTEKTEAVPEKRETNPMIRFHRAFAGIAAAAAIVFLTSFSVKAMGGDLWEFVIKWTKETFSYHTGSAMDVPPPDTIGQYSAKDEREFLIRHDMTTVFVPQWLPEGYVLEDMLMDESYSRREALFIYKKEQEELHLSIRTSVSDEVYGIESSREQYDTHESDGITLYIYDNLEVIQGFWMTKKYECRLSGQVSREEIIMIFDSMEKDGPDENEKT